MLRIIHSYRLNTGDLTLASVGDASELRVPLLPSVLGATAIAGQVSERCSVQTKAEGRVLNVTIGSGQPSLLRAWVVLDGRDLARIVPGPRVLDLPPPVCIVEVLKPGPIDPVVGWLRLLLDALALAWVSHCRSSITSQ
jgi:hypothetical protein